MNTRLRPLDCVLHKLRHTAQQVAYATAILSAIHATMRSLRISAVHRSKTVKDSEAGRDVLEEFRDVVLDGGAVVGGCQQVFTVFGDMDTAYGAGVVA